MVKTFWRAEKFLVAKIPGWAVFKEEPRFHGKKPVFRVAGTMIFAGVFWRAKKFLRGSSLEP